MVEIHWERKRVGKRKGKRGNGRERREEEGREEIWESEIERVEKGKKESKREHWGWKEDIDTEVRGGGSKRKRQRFCKEAELAKRKGWENKGKEKEKKVGEKREGPESEGKGKAKRVYIKDDTQNEERNALNPAHTAAIT